MFKIGDLLIIRSTNENYAAYRNKVLVVTKKATCVDEHPGYDEGMRGMPLYDFKTEDGQDFPFSLYQYEVDYYSPTGRDIQ